MNLPFVSLGRSSSCKSQGFKKELVFKKKQIKPVNLVLVICLKTTQVMQQPLLMPKVELERRDHGTPFILICASLFHPGNNTSRTSLVHRPDRPPGQPAWWSDPTKPLLPIPMTQNSPQPLQPSDLTSETPLLLLLETAPPPLRFRLPLLLWERLLAPQHSGSFEHLLQPVCL